MSDTSPFGFGRFVPGFDFLQSLAKGASAGMPGMTGWVAPTASVQELDKRIQELKAVQFWLEQNARGLTAMVQALEVQKMTMATLQGMNMAMGDVASAFGGAAAAPAAAPGPAAPSASADAAREQAPGQSSSAQEAGQAGLGALADPLQWWGPLTSQFQQIAARAMQDAAAHQATFEATRDMASGALKSASDMASQWMQPASGGGAAADQKKDRAKAAAAAPRSRSASAAPAPAAKAAPPKRGSR